MRRHLFAGMLLFSCFSLSAQNDVIMLRDGREKHVKITQVGRRQTFYKAKDDKKADEDVIDNDAIYMLKYEKRGNAYFDKNGQLMSATTEPVTIPDDACTIYTFDRREIPAWNVSILENMVTYCAERPSKKRKQKDFSLPSEATEGGIFNRRKRKNYNVPIVASIPKVDVFFIRYPDGTRDVVNEFTKPTAEMPAVQQTDTIVAEQQSAQEETETTDESSREYPCHATIITKKNVKMNVFIYAEDATTVSYRKVKSEKASIFKIARKNIANIKY